MSFFSSAKRAPVHAAIAVYARTDCPECGASIPVRGLAAPLDCKACNTRTAPTQDFWSGIFFRLFTAFPGTGQVALRLGGALTGELPIYARYREEPPSCARCRAPLVVPPAASAQPHATFPCAACGAPAQVFWAPDWARQEFPDLRLVIEPVPLDAAAPAPNAPNAPRPVAFGCQECGGKLKLTPDMPRLLECRFCRAMLYLPQELWNAVHPAEKRSAFWIVVERP